MQTTLAASLSFLHLSSLAAAALARAHGRGRGKRWDRREFFARAAGAHQQAEAAAAAALKRLHAGKSLRRFWWGPGMALWGATTRLTGEKFCAQMQEHLLRKAELICRTTATRADEAGEVGLAAELRLRERAFSELMVEAGS
jgi:hypothetical protein